MTPRRGQISARSRFVTADAPVESFMNERGQQLVVVVEMTCVEGQYGVDVRDDVGFDADVRGECPV